MSRGTTTTFFAGRGIPLANKRDVAPFVQMMLEIRDGFRLVTSPPGEWIVNRTKKGWTVTFYTTAPVQKWVLETDEKGIVRKISD